jgi:hypothetical protein
VTCPAYEHVAILPIKFIVLDPVLNCNIPRPCNDTLPYFEAEFGRQCREEREALELSMRLHRSPTSIEMSQRFQKLSAGVYVKKHGLMRCCADTLLEKSEGSKAWRIGAANLGLTQLGSNRESVSVH